MSTTESSRYLSFSIGTEEFAVPLLKVREVIGLPEITPVPNTPTHFLGVINLRGQVISVLDLRKKLGRNCGEGSDRAIIICDLGGLSLGVLVDSINSVLAPEADELSPPPDLEEGRRTAVTGIYRRGKSLVLLIDLPQALDFTERAA